MKERDKDKRGRFQVQNTVSIRKTGKRKHVKKCRETDYQN
jgi:hypothetical protein